MKFLNKHILALWIALAIAVTSYGQCTPVAAPFYENFAGTTTPTCWTQSQTAVNNQWRFTGAPGYTAAGVTSKTPDGSHFAWTDFSFVNPSSTLTMPEIDVTTLATPALSFWYYSHFTAIGVNNILIVEASNGAGGWTQIASIQQNTPAWEYKLYDLTNYTYGTNLVQLRFTAQRGAATGTFFYNDLIIDDVLVDEAPTCFSPTNLVGTLSGNDVILSWTANTSTPANNGYVIEYGFAGFMPGTGTVVTTLNTTDTITGLSNCAAYDFYVRAECSPGDLSLAINALNIATPPGILVAPLYQPFASPTLPNCYTQSATSVNDQWRFIGNMGADLIATTSQTPDVSRFAWLDFSFVANPSSLTFPEMDISGLPSAALSFWYISYFTNATGINNILKVEASDGAGSWTQIATIQQNQPGWQFKIYDLSTFTYGANNNLVQIRFTGQRGAATGTFFYNDIAIDDVRIDALPTSLCAAQPAPDTLNFEDGGALNACWEQSVNDVLDWTIQSGATPSAGTGPSDAHNGSYYAYLESSGTVVAGDSAVLISPPINTATLPDAPALYFNYHMFGNDYMTLRAEYEVFGSNSWIKIWERTGQLQSTKTDAYASAYVPMPNAIGSLIRVRFTAVAAANDGVSTAQGGADASDIAIDDVRIANVLANEVTITNITAPGNACGLGVEPVTIEVTNLGFNDQNNVPVFLKVNGSTPVGLATGNINGNGGTTTITALVDMTNLGTYTFDAYTALPNDEVPDNDDFTLTTTHQPEIAGEYEQGFEMDNGLWSATGDWAYGTPSATLINSAGAGDKAFVTNLAGNYNDSRISYLTSPCFDISTMTTPVLRFSIFWDLEDTADGAWLEYTTSGGQTWTKLGVNNFAGQNWYTDSLNNAYGWAWTGAGANGSGGWLDAIIDLQPYGFDVATEVKFRFVVATNASANNEGLGIDNFGIYDGCLKAVANPTVLNVSKDGETDGAITLNTVGGFGGYTFTWSNGSTGNTVSNLAVGTYAVTITDAFGCSTTESFEVISVCPSSLGLQTNATPNIGDGGTSGAATVLPTNGAAPYTFSWSNGISGDYVDALSAGDYTVVVTDANGCTDSTSITIQTVYLVGTENLEGLTNFLLAPNPTRDFAQLNLNFDRAVDLTVRIVDMTGRVLETRNAGNTADASMRFDVSTYAAGVYFMHIIANNQTATKRFVVVK